MKRYIQADILFLATGALTLLVGLLFYNSTLDIAIHDMYFLISYFLIALILGATFLLFALIYYSFKRAGRPMYRILALMHYFLTVLPILATTLIDYSPSRHLSNQDFRDEMENAEKLNIIISALAFLWLIGQLIFITNILTTIMRKNASR
jgi:heme/copper-type cytochrome/quinol oxidase subunit 1